jgi:hypothetical protein
MARKVLKPGVGLVDDGEVDFMPDDPPEVPADTASAFGRPPASKLSERLLPVRLTAAEHRVKAEELARTVDEIHAVQARKKVANENFKAEEAKWVGVQTALAHEVETGEELRRVQCQYTDDLTHKQRHTYRCDTGELVDSRPLTTTELQARLDV